MPEGGKRKEVIVFRVLARFVESCSIPYMEPEFIFPPRMSKHSSMLIPRCYRTQKSLQVKFYRRKLHKLKFIIAHGLANSLYRDYLNNKIKSVYFTRNFGIDSKKTASI